MTEPGRNRILVVDDHPDAADIACVLLVALGQDCRAAKTGGAALLALDTFAASIVILDIGLPDLSGYEVARAIRLRPGGGDIFLVALSGWGQPEDVARAADAGFDRHCLKPASADLFHDILADAARRQHAHADAHAHAS